MDWSGQWGCGMVRNLGECGIPLLTGQAARRFIAMAERAQAGPRIDFSKQTEIMRKILAKSRLYPGK